MPSTPTTTSLTLHDWGGPPGSPTLVLLHGLADSGRCWPGAVNRWSADYRVVSLDHLGHGTSPRYTAEQLSAEDPMEEMYAAAERSVASVARGRGPVVLVGHSMGGGVATALAVRRPDLVVAALLEEPAWRDPADRVDDEDAVAERITDCRGFRDDPEGALRMGRVENPRWPEEEFLPWAEAKRQVDLDFLRLGVASFATDWLSWIEALTVPTLAVLGADSSLVPEPARRRARAVGNPNLGIEVVEGAGHSVRREVGDVFHGLVDPWLEQTTRGTRGARA